MDTNEDNTQRSGVNFGSNNIYLGPIHEIAGRDIHHHTTVQNFIINNPFDIAKLLSSERDFGDAVQRLYSSIATYFIPPRLRKEIEVTDLEVPDEFKVGFSPELSSLLQRSNITSHPQRRQEPVSYRQLLTAENSLIVAPLGYGKSTLLRMVAFEGARNITSRFLTEVSEEEYLGLRLPIYVNLNGFDDRLSLIDFAKQYAWHDPGYGFAAWKATAVYSLFDIYLAKGKFFFLFDSIDFLSTSHLNKIQSEIEWIITNYPGNRIILASRSDEISYDLGLSRVYIDEWSKTEIGSFFERRLGKTKGTRAYNLLAHDYAHIIQWGAIPYVAFALALYYNEHEDFPKESARLGEKLVSALIQRDIKKDESNTTMINNLERFLSEVAFRAVEMDLGLELKPDIVTQAAKGIGQDRVQLINECLQLGFLTTGQENKIGFKNQLVGDYFVGKYLQHLFTNSRDEFLRLTNQPVRQDQLKHPRRSAMFRKPVIGQEIAWDRPLPKLESLKWFNGLSMAVAMLTERQSDFLIDVLTTTTSLTAGELLDSLKLSISSKTLQKTIDSLIATSQEPSNALRARLKALFLIGSLGDPRIGDAKMCLIPKGKASLTITDPDNYITVDVFSLDTFPVTNAQYQRFLLGGGYEKQSYWTRAGWHWVQKMRRSEPTYWRDNRYNSPNQPVVGVSWYEAYAYSQWAKKRLPTEAEWERAAAWDPETNTIRCYPTGNTMMEGIGNLLIEEFEYVYCSTPVGAYPFGKSQNGVYDLVGNVWEWVSTKFSDSPLENSADLENQEGNNERCLRGGSWGFEQVPGAICTTRHWAEPGLCSPKIGFRCAAEAAVSP